MKKILKKLTFKQIIMLLIIFLLIGLYSFTLLINTIGLLTMIYGFWLIDIADINRETGKAFYKNILRAIVVTMIGMFLMIGYMQYNNGILSGGLQEINVKK